MIQRWVRRASIASVWAAKIEAISADGDRKIWVHEERQQLEMQPAGCPLPGRAAAPTNYSKSAKSPSSRSAGYGNMCECGECKTRAAEPLVHMGGGSKARRTSLGSSSSPYCITKSMWLSTVSIESGFVRSSGRNLTNGWSSICAAAEMHYGKPMHVGRSVAIEQKHTAENMVRPVRVGNADL